TLFRDAMPLQMKQLFRHRKGKTEWDRAQVRLGGSGDRRTFHGILKDPAGGGDRRGRPLTRKKLHEAVQLADRLGVFGEAERQVLELKLDFRAFVDRAAAIINRSEKPVSR